MKHLFCTLGRKQPVSEHTPTLLIVYFHPVRAEGVRYHLDETLTTAGIVYSVIAETQERVALEGSAPFVITHNEKRLVLALSAPLDERSISEIAQLVVTGLMLGFVVKGEIALGGDGAVFNNLGG
jgi:hypothetical protein